MLKPYFPILSGNISPRNWLTVKKKQIERNCMSIRNE